MAVQDFLRIRQGKRTHASVVQNALLSAGLRNLILQAKKQARGKVPIVVCADKEGTVEGTYVVIRIQDWDHFVGDK